MNRDLSIIKGNTIAFKMAFSDLEEDLTDAFFSAKKNITDSEYVFQVKLNEGISRVEGSDEYVVNVPATITKTMEVGSYYYDLVIVIGSTVNTLLKGVLSVEPTITNV